MLTLGIETSCDETSCAVLENEDGIRANVVSSSLFRHKPFGGIVPEIASRHCLEQIDFVYKQTLRQAKVKVSDIDLIAVTQGPGLIGSLFVGVCFAKSLSYSLGIPMVGVNHLEAHLEAPFMTNDGKYRDKIFVRKPKKFIGLLVSGGHTMLTHHQGDQVSILGETVDDAIGEAYDKVAKMMGLGYPGGPIIDRMAYEGDSKEVSFTKPKQKKPYDFSFSGIKTAVLYYYQRQALKTRSKKMLEKLRKDIAASFQKATIGWLVDKTMRAAKEFKIQDIAVGGGVSANSLLRRWLTEEGEKEGIRVHIPHLSLTNDNAAMIAKRGWILYKTGQKAPLNLSGSAHLPIAASQ